MNGDVYVYVYVYGYVLTCMAIDMFACRISHEICRMYGYGYVHVYVYVYVYG